MPRLKKFCRLTKYLENIDKNLYQTFDDLCLFSLFSTRGGRGVTFLYPSDASYRKKIINLAYSNTPEKAVDMLKSLVIMDYLPKPVDFKNKKDDIPNSLRKKLEVDDADAKEVKLKGGLKLVLDTGFTPLRSDDPVVVYKLSGKGELSTSGLASTMKYMQNKRGGGYYRGGASGLSLVADKVVEKYSSGVQNIYKIFLAYVYKQASEKGGEFLKYVYEHMCATERASFYNILQPYSTSNTADIPQDVCFGLSVMVNNCDTCIEKMEHFVGKWKVNRDDVITKARTYLNITNVQELYKTKYNAQKNIISSSSKALDYARKTRNYYSDKSDKSDDKLASDLMSIYSFLSILLEKTDPSYYQNCYIWSMKNTFKDKSNITSSYNDAAHHITLYGNLLKTDAFDYIPTISTECFQDDSYTKYTTGQSSLPEPDSKDMISIEKNSIVAVYGGSDVAAMV